MWKVEDHHVRENTSMAIADLVVVVVVVVEVPTVRFLMARDVQIRIREMMVREMTVREMMVRDETMSIAFRAEVVDGSKEIVDGVTAEETMEIVGVVAAAAAAAAAVAVAVETIAVAVAETTADLRAAAEIQVVDVIRGFHAEVERSSLREKLLKAPLTAFWNCIRGATDFFG